jgi:L-histidine N-alpha-methyltransferase
MMTTALLAPQVDAPASPSSAFLQAILHGLSQNSKAIPCRFLYDAQGSKLFDQICLLPEYYPTRTEKNILASAANEIGAMVGAGARFIELGAGSGGKAEWLLNALPAPRGYICIDISPVPLAATRQAIADTYPGLHTAAICADYLGEFALPHCGNGPDLCFFPGSTIGNFERDEAQAFLAGWRHRMGEEGMMLIGVDLQKDIAVLEAAYDDAQGVTAQFSLNVLARANRELGANFDLSQFRHRARYIAEPGHIRIDLVSRIDQTVVIAGHSIAFASGEAVHIENSHKYTVDEFTTMADSAGFASARVWTDPQQLFSLHLLQAKG